MITTKKIKKINKKNTKVNRKSIETLDYDYKKYLNIIKQNLKLDKTKWFFKSTREVKMVVENIGLYYGNLYLEEIKHKFKNLFTKNKKILIELCKENDRYGKPYKKEFKQFMTCSAKNLCYILHSLLILTFMKKHKLNNIDIIEIGGGYGGLAFFIIKMSQLFNIKINSYTIFDLPDASKLQKVYLEALHLTNNMNFYQVNNFNNLKENSFLISNYALTELSMILQKEYKDKILNPYVSYGFLVWSFIPIYDFIDNKIISSELEVPDTSNNNTNHYVTFVPK